MPVKIAVELPYMEKGTELDVGGVLVKNGESVELDDEQEMRFVSMHQKTPKEWAGESPHVKVTGTGKVSEKEMKEMFPETTGTPAQEEAKEEQEKAPAEGSNS